MIIKPQPGPQEDFSACPADIAIYGGAAGGGKTYGLLIEPPKYMHFPGFGAVMFRRTMPQITKEGSMWDTSFQLYPHIGGVARENTYTWLFAHRNKIQMSQLQYESTVMDYQGSQIPLMCFDQLEQFTKRQFFFMMSRNRSACGIMPYIRATANPVPDSDPVGGWLRDLIDWWIGDDGLPIQSRSGVIRYFARGPDDAVLWVSKDWRSPDGDPPKSITFIPAKLTDNPILMKLNPGYRQGLASMSKVDRERMLGGNWNIREEPGMFAPEWFRIQDQMPPMQLVRYWDRAASEKRKGTDPDWTCGALCGIVGNRMYISDIRRFRGNPGENESKIKQVAQADGKQVIIYIEQEPGSSGKDSFHHYQSRVLAGYTVRPDRPTGDKVTRAKDWCAMAEFGNVILKKGDWNKDFLVEVERFPSGKKDQVDAVSGAYASLAGLSTAKASFIRF